jgi:hypothetical protein
MKRLASLRAIQVGCAFGPGQGGRFGLLEELERL